MGEHLVSGIVTKGIVDPLEIVDVTKGYAKMRIAAAATRTRSERRRAGRFIAEEAGITEKVRFIAETRIEAERCIFFAFLSSALCIVIDVLKQNCNRFEAGFTESVVFVGGKGTDA